MMQHAHHAAHVDELSAAHLCVDEPCWSTTASSTSFLGLFGLGPFNMINTSGAVVLGMVYNYLPFMILPMYTSHDEDRQLASSRPRRTWAANVWQILLRVLVPL